MKKVRIFLATLFFIVVNVCTMQAVTNYPIQLTAQVLPPYGTCLSDYVVGGMERINITALQRDLTLSMYEINLQMQVKQGTKVILKSNSKYQLRPGIITKLPAAALFSALSDVDASTKYKENGFCFPEGAYEFVFQAFDARNSKLPVSEPVYFFAYLNKTQPPYCVFPADNACVDYSSQDINFVWVEPTVSMPTNNKRYALEIYEMPDGFDAVRDNAASMASTLTPIYNEEDINGITTMHPLHQAAGLFIKGRSYAWRVRTYSVKNRMVNSESKLYNTSDYVENNGYSKFSTFHFKKCVGQDDIWKKEDKKVLTCDLTLKPVIEKVDTANSKAVVVWKKEEDKFTCGYIVEWNLIDTLAAPWGQVKVPAGESQYELKNLKKGVKYIARVRGLVCPKSGSSDTIYSAYSDTLHFQLKKENESDCGHPVPGLSSTVSLKSALSNGSWITANGHDIKVLTCTMDVAGGDTTFTGTGLVSYGFLTNLVSLTVKFDKVKINEQNELMQGMVYCNTDKDNCLDFNLNGQANKKSAGSGPASLQESKLQTYDNASQMPNGSVGIVGDNVVVKDESGKTQEIGKEQKDEPGSCAPKTSCYDDQAAFVSFAPQEQWNPPFDAEQGIFTKSLSISDYYDKIERHTIPWIAMPAGETNKIYANLKIEPGSGVKPEDVYFICRSKNQTVRLKATQDGDSRFIVPIYGGEEGKCLEIVAMADTVKAGNAACSQLFTLGRAKVMSMKKETITLHIVPFRRDKSKVDGVSIENTLNTIYKPLGKTFKVEVEERFGDGEEYDFVEDGLSVEGSGFMKTETEEMSMLKSLYNMEIGFSEEDNQAYLFVLPKAGTDGVLGDMPRNKPVGYVFADPSSVYADGHTVAHEIGHGIFTFDHAFEYYSGDQGQTSNLMDYTQGGQNNDLKVWQWSVMDTHKNYVLPFLEGDEDGMYKPWSFVDGPILSEFRDYHKLKERYAFLDPNGVPFLLPGETKNIRFSSASGSVLSFVDSKGDLWVAVEYSESKIFTGYYKDAKATSKVGDESYSVNTSKKAKYQMIRPSEGEEVYVPIASKSEDCPIVYLYAIGYTLSEAAKKNPQQSIIEMGQQIQKLKNTVFYIEGEGIEKITQSRLAYQTDANYNINCFSSSMKKFYLFMTNYYNVFSSPGEKGESLKKTLYDILRTYAEVKVFNVDVFDTENYTELTTNKNKDDIFYILKENKDYTADMSEGIGTLYVKFDVATVYKDFYLNTTGKCTQAEWEKSISDLIAKKKEAEVNIDAFSEDILDNLCPDWISNLKYKEIEDLLDIIITQSLKQKKAIKEKSERAMLKLMSLINPGEYYLFADYLKKSNFEKLLLFIDEFDDASIFPWDKDNYTSLMKVLVKMYNTQPDDFIKDLTISEYDVAYQILDLSDQSMLGGTSYHLQTNSKNGKMTLSKSFISGTYPDGSPKYSLQVVEGLENVSPFTPFYLDASKIEIDAIKAAVDETGCIMVPLFFMKFWQDKIFNDNMKTVAEVALDIASVASGAGGVAAATKALSLYNKGKKAKLLITSIKGITSGTGTILSSADLIFKLGNINNELTKVIGYVNSVATDIDGGLSIAEAKLWHSGINGNTFTSAAIALATLWHQIYIEIDGLNAKDYENSKALINEIAKKMKKLAAYDNETNKLQGAYIAKSLYKNELIDKYKPNISVADAGIGSKKIILSREDYKKIIEGKNINRDRNVYCSDFEEGETSPFSIFYSEYHLKYVTFTDYMVPSKLSLITGNNQIKDEGYAVLTVSDPSVELDGFKVAKELYHENKGGNVRFYMPTYVISKIDIQKLGDYWFVELIDSKGKVEEKYYYDYENKMLRKNE